MTNINISLNKEAYKFLKLLKGKEKSFSEIILEFKRDISDKKGTKEAILKFSGAMKNNNINWKEKEKNIKIFRSEMEKEIDDRIRHNRHN